MNSFSNELKKYYDSIRRVILKSEALEEMVISNPKFSAHNRTAIYTSIGKENVHGNY